MLRFAAAFCTLTILSGQNAVDRLRVLAAEAKAAEESENLNEAVRLYKEMLRLRPNWAAAEMNLGLVYYSQKRYPDSIETLTKAVTHKPDLASAWLFLGAALSQTEEYEKAIPALKRHLDYEPSSAEAHAYLATAYLGLNDYLKAGNEYLAVLQAAGPPEDSYFRLTDCYLQSARSSLESLGADANPNYYFFLVSAEELLPTARSAQAEALIRKAIGLQPNAPEAYEALGRLLTSQGKAPEADAALQQARKLEPRPPRCQPPAPALERARCHGKGDDLGAATVALQQARTAAAAGDPRTEYWSFQISKRLAQRSIDRLAAASPSSPLLHTLRAQIAEQNGQNQEAEQAYRRALAEAPSPETFILYGKFKCKLDQLEEGLQLFNKALESDPDNALTKGLIGEVLLLNNHPGRALPYLSAAVEGRPRDIQSRLNLAKCLGLLGREKESIKILEGAGDRRDSRILYALATAYRRVGETEKAARAFEAYRRQKGRVPDRP